jgi:hypothetical protein
VVEYLVGERGTFWGNNGYLEVIKYLVLVGADVHAEGDCALRWASENGHLGVTRYLIGVGADVHGRNDEALR